MADSTPSLPIARQDHPLYRREYRVATPSIELFAELVRRCLKSRVPGALIYARSRYGKTHAIQYMRLLLKREFPKVPTYHVQVEHQPNHTQGAFFANLLASVHVPLFGAMSNVAKRAKLLTKILEQVHAEGSNWAVFFCDEAQRYNQNEYEWLRDVHDALNLHNVRLFVFLVGQPPLLTQKIRLRQLGDDQIVMRFMVEELQFHGIRTAEEAAICMNSYDETTYPEKSDWSYTRFFFLQAFANGYRFAQEAHLLWNAFVRAHEEHKLSGKLDVPMDNFARAIEYLFLESPAKDASNFTFGSDMMRHAVTQSLYVQSMRAYSPKGSAG